MARLQANGLEFEYEEYGSKDDPMMLLINGFSSQMTSWPASFKQGLVDAGRRVVIYDNRDIGLSAELSDQTPPAPRDIIEGLAAGQSMHEKVPYVLDDMAKDAAEIITALGAEDADIMGVSMGGMISQILALNHPERVRKVIPTMTTSGAPGLPTSTPEAQQALTAQPKNRSLEALSELAVKNRAIFGSHTDLRDSDEQIYDHAMKTYQRSDRPMGVARQYAAILAQPRWHERLNTLNIPTLVLHGDRDTLIPSGAGEDIARRVPKAKMSVIEKWGHDMPHKAVPILLNEIVPFIKG